MEPIKLLGFAGLELIANELLPLNYLKRTGGTLNGNLNISNKSPVLTIQNTDHNEVSLVLDRNGYANWRFLSNNGDLYFQSDYTDKKGDYYNVMVLNYNSGNASFRGTVTAPTFAGNLSGTASVATKLGSSTIGNTLKPFYLNAGVPTAFTSTVGAANKFIYLNAGTITASNATIGSTSIPVYLNAGTITPCTSLSLNTTGSAAKWTTARTLSLTGSVTGSVSFDGSGNISLSTSTNHTHNYAGSSYDGGAAISANMVNGIYTGSGGKQPPSYIPYGKIRFNMMNVVINGYSGYQDWLLMDTYTGSDVPFVTAFGIGKSPYPRAFIMTGEKKGDSWDNTAELLSNVNYTTYCPTKNGTGAGGTWAISVTGNATTATKATQDGSGNVITSKYVAVDTAQTITGSKTFSGLTSVTNTIASTSKSTGALKVSGGMGVSGQISADKMMVGDKVILQYNVANECIDFIFA